jgi:hypothetical protein
VVATLHVPRTAPSASPAAAVGQWGRDAPADRADLGLKLRLVRSAADMVSPSGEHQGPAGGERRIHGLGVVQTPSTTANWSELCDHYAVEPPSMLWRHTQRNPETGLADAQRLWETPSAILPGEREEEEAMVHFNWVGPMNRARALVALAGFQSIANHAILGAAVFAFMAVPHRLLSQLQDGRKGEMVWLSGVPKPTGNWQQEEQEPKYLVPSYEQAAPVQVYKTKEAHTKAPRTTSIHPFTGATSEDDHPTREHRQAVAQWPQQLAEVMEEAGDRYPHYQGQPLEGPRPTTLQWLRAWQAQGHPISALMEPDQYDWPTQPSWTVPRSMERCNPKLAPAGSYNMVLQSRLEYAEEQAQRDEGQAAWAWRHTRDARSREEAARADAQDARRLVQQREKQCRLTD